MNAQPTTMITLAPPFTRETAILKVRAVEDNWNSRDPERVARAYAVDCYWRNRSEFIRGREEVVAFLTRKWAAELDYRLIKEIWAFDENRIAVRFAYESHDHSGQWHRSYGVQCRRAVANPARQHQRPSDQRAGPPVSLPLGRRPDQHPGLTELGL
jgi:nuclear transport factor 2 (NTF2) superfamily protein